MTTYCARLIASFVLLYSASLLATNGANLISSTTASRGMGGTGVAHFHDERTAAIMSPSLLSKSMLPDGGWNFGLDLTYLNGNVRSDVRNYTDTVSSGEKESKHRPGYIPAIAAVNRVNEHLVWGFVYYGAAGSMVDYKDEVTHSKLKVEYGMARLGVAASYRQEKFSFGLAPLYNMGNFAINTREASGEQSSRKPDTQGAFGIQVGASLFLLDELTVSLTYLSPAKFKYKGVVDLDAYTLTEADGKLDDLSLDQPTELAFGLSWLPITDLGLALDFRSLDWAATEGFGDIGWKRQLVIALGGKYRIDAFTLRAGVNMANGPIEDVSGEVGLETSDVSGKALTKAGISGLNAVGFPAISETHYTLGLGHMVNEQFSWDLAFMMSPKASLERSGTVTSPAGSAPYSLKTSVSQYAFSAGVSYNLW